MGVSTTYYTVYGIKHDYDGIKEFLEGPYEDAYYDDDTPTITPTIIVDSMSGEYAIFGKVLYDSGDLYEGECKDSFVEIDLKTLPEIEASYKKEFITKFPEYSHLLDRPFKLMTFVHYS